jgi:hypothetical protein
MSSRRPLSEESNNSDKFTVHSQNSWQFSNPMT